MATHDVVSLVLVAISLTVLVFASDQNPLQDFCVADPTIQGIMQTFSFLASAVLCTLLFLL